MNRRQWSRLVLAIFACVLSLSAMLPAIPAWAQPAQVAPASGGVWYTVKAGDTLSGISAHFDVSVAGIVSANKLGDSRSVSVGQRLYLPHEVDSSAKSTNASQAAPAPNAPPAAPTSAPGKVIYISLTKQHLWAYDTGQLKYSFIASSGLPNRPTKPGTFRVQSRIPDAWSNVWQLSMPYWLGIYNVGRIENGIHALPINKRGVRLWAGLLGKPASFGCIILNTPDAVSLYNWADIGTLVIIRY